MADLRNAQIAVSLKALFKMRQTMFLLDNTYFPTTPDVMSEIAN